MYGFKEKNKHLNELRNPAAAEADLKLLQAADPAHLKLKMFARNPQRYESDILYTLLDYKSKNDIRFNRRECEKNKEKNGAETIPNTGNAHLGGEIQSGWDSQGAKDEAGNAPSISRQLLSDGSEREGNNPGCNSGVQSSTDGNTKTSSDPNEGAGTTSVEQEKQEAKKTADQAETLEQENQELKEELEAERDARTETEERAEQAEQALEKEKKKEPTKAVPKSKSTKNTHK